MQIPKGLTSAQVAERVAAGKTNVITAAQSKTYADILRSNVFTFFNLIHLILFLCVMFVGEYKNATFICIILANTIIGVFQEMRAKRKVDKLKILTSPRVQVVRNGAIMELDVTELVEDDIVLFSTGSQICADAVVIDGLVEVNEALITGEADAVKKENGCELLSGSFVSSGKCCARLVRVGDLSYAAKLASEAKKHKKIKSELLNSLNKIIKTVGYVLIPLGLLLLIKQYAVIAGEGAFSVFQWGAFVESVTKTVAALIGMIPEGLYLLTSVALAVSLMRLARKKALVQEMYAIESLARVDVLCIDKTGTITSGNMQVEAVEDLSAKDEAKQYMPSMLAALADNSVTSIALADYFGTRGSLRAKRVIPFSSSRKWSGCEFSDGCYVFGAAEFILKDKNHPIFQKINTYYTEGKRVLLFARCESMNDEIIVGAKPLALFLIVDEIRRNAKRTFQFFKKNAVCIKVISGDNPVAVSAISARAGIDNADKYIDLSGMRDFHYEELVEKYTVFGRVKPEQKRELIRALKRRGHTVGMTGDGVNDVLALKDADCSIAMASGSDAACKVSNIVLADSDFSSMPMCVFEGRRVINNIQRSGALFLVKTIFSFALAVLTVLLPFSYPFIPIRLSLLSAITIGLPGFCLALQPDKSRVTGGFLQNILQKAIPSAISVVTCLTVLMTVEKIFQIDDPNIVGTCALFVTGFIGFETLFRICRPFDRYRLVVFCGCFILFWGAALFFHDFFELVAMPWWLILLTIVLMLGSIPLTVQLSGFVKKKFARHSKKRKR